MSMESRDPKNRGGGNPRDFQVPSGGHNNPGDKRNPNQKQNLSLTLTDVYYVLFRRKWLILISSVLGIFVAIGLYFKSPTAYSSQAKVMVKRVYDNTGVPVSGQGDMNPVTPVTGGPEGLINSEVEILSSFDLALRVVSNVPPQKILAKYGGGSGVVAAAGIIHNNLVPERIPKSSVLQITLTLRDPESVQSILNSVIAAYQQLHDEIHVKSDALVELEQQATSLHNKLQDKQISLQNKLKSVGVTDVEEARKSSGDMAEQIHLGILNTQEELEFSKQKLAKLKGNSKPSDATPQTNAVAAQADIPKEKLDRYNQASKLLANLKDEYLKLLSTYTPDSQTALEKQAQVERAEKAKAELEKEEPRLATIKKPAVLDNGQSSVNSTEDTIFKEEAQVAALESKLKMLQATASEIKTNIANLDAIAADVHDLKLNIKLLEQDWQSAETAAENATLEANMQGLNNANISVVEHPTPATPALSKTSKAMAMAAAAGILGGIGLAFLLELYLDHTVKRPKEIEGDLGMRLFLTIPDTSKNGNGKPRGNFKRKALAEKTETNGNGSHSSNLDGDTVDKCELALWDKRHSLHQYNEALRDRLISYFYVNNMTHKPKLVAVTGAAKAAGTSTIASGLAASLSETGDGNVLLVDMNVEQGEAQQFYMGKPACELDAALAKETRNNALVQDKLYMVSGRSNGSNLSRMLPRAFASLMPRLEASDFDYIIFDMPPIGRTGISQRLAGFMDMTLLVVEAEKTSRDVVKQAGAILSESKANVSVVLNKRRKYIPARFHQEI